MNREDIIRMAREWLPKAYRNGDVDDEPKFTKHNMEVAFAAGAAAEREACAQAARTAMLGVDWVLTERVLKAIRKRGEKE